MTDEALIKELLDDATDRMHKSVESTRNELATVRTGRASPQLLDRLVVDYYGAETPHQAAGADRDLGCAHADPDPL